MNQLENTLTSLEVAEMVGRDHSKVIRDIRNITSHLTEAKNGFSDTQGKSSLSEYFTEDTYKDSTGRELPCYRLTKKGCELFSTRMTGAKGTQFAVAYIERFNQMESHIKQQPQLSQPQDDYAKRLRAEAMNQNARNRAAKELIEMAKDATSEVNKALLQDKAVEVLTGEKLLEMPTLAGKMYSTDEIAKEIGIYSKSEKPHGTAVSWLIKRYLELKDGDYEVFAESVNGWSGTVTRYSQSVVERLKEKIESLGYPTIVTSEGGVNYHVHYRNIV